MQAEEEAISNPPRRNQNKSEMAPDENQPHFDMNFFQGQIKITQDFIFGRKCENIVAGNDLREYKTKM